ncbi:MAG: OmpA family protein [Terriglobia bacterium]
MLRTKQVIRLTMISVLVIALGGLAQTQGTDQQAAQEQTVPIYRVTVVGRTVKAINYRTLSGSTKIDFRGTSLMAHASGKATVTSRLSATRVQADFRDMAPASSFGPEYLTYVLWAITPDGRPVNVAEIVPDNGKAKLDVTVNLQAFGMIVTAEPYFAVRMPSDVVVLENEVTQNTVGKIEEVNAKFQLLKRGQYIKNVNRDEVQPIVMSPKTPLALYEAENAVRIARWADAAQNASSTFDKAEQLLSQARAYQARKAGQKPVIMTAREAVQTAEDARTIAIRRAQQEHTAELQRQNEQRATEARQHAQQEAAARAQAEQAQQQAEQAQQEAQARAERARAQAEQAQQQAQQAQARAQQAEQQRTQARERLLQQLNSILQTRQTSRGLVVTMSHVFFQTGQATLSGDTKVALAKLAGVLLAYPGVKIEVDGYTDNTGSEETNQELSEKRADAVETFLVQQGVPESSITAHGMGESNPVAPNDTAMGRAMNRRVEIVITGGVIGIPTNSSNNASQ